MNWDWEKLQEKRQRQTNRPFSSQNSNNNNNNSDDSNKKSTSNFNFEPKFPKVNFKFSQWKFLIIAAILVWLGSGIFIIQPDEVGVVMLFNKYNRTVEPGPHYHLPYPIETVYKPKVSQVQRAEVGFVSGNEAYVPQKTGATLDEASMLTGDENIVSVQFSVQYQIKDPVAFLFNIPDQAMTVKSASEAAMREVVGYNNIDSVLTDGRLQIQNSTHMLLQEILDRYGAGVRVIAVQMQDVHPPKEVIDAFKDVASAREDKSRIINEAEAYRNEILPKTRGLAAEVLNQAEAYKESTIRLADGEAKKFLAVLEEFNKAKEITTKRMYLETMEEILASPNLEKILIPENQTSPTIPFLPLNRTNPSSN